MRTELLDLTSGPFERYLLTENTSDKDVEFVGMDSDGTMSKLLNGWTLLENSDNDMAFNLIAINNLCLYDVWGFSLTSIKVAVIVVF